MIVAFSTSSPLASVALIDEAGTVLGEHVEEAPMRASGVCMRGLERLLSEGQLGLHEATGFLADLGPGSFTGVRVGVTLAKTLAFTRGVDCGGASSFDLIAPDRTVAIPSKKGEYFVREPGGEPIRVSGTEWLDKIPLGYGQAFVAQTHPRASGFASILQMLSWVAPEALNPLYLIEPSISQPKRPYAPGATHA